MNSKEYKFADGRTAVFDYDENGIGKITLECMDALMGMITQQWIPCSERLPKDDDWQIVTILDERGDTPYRYSDFGWYLNRAECWIIDAEQRTDVIAWKPLPSPYKGDKS